MQVKVAGHGTINVNGTIPLGDVLAHIESGLPFDAVVVKASRRRGTGGELFFVKQWLKNNLPAEEKEVKGRVHKLVKQETNHWLNKTRHIFNPKNGEIRKIYIKLIKVFNGKEVTL